ncbi:imidazolonepropionase-like domain-containing protein [Streptomyces sp. NPDC050418]|uniref:imidazolonepropionase-like domain-containing protein n=1 Tax=Streptomyces sp. NPDC050418 TaxID=3365612 RepID=UPI0037912FE2
MPTLHVTSDGAVLVEGDTVAALGTPGELTAAHPSARVRQWPGILTPGLLNPYGPEILESTYHPDPREAEEFGTVPIGGARAREIFRAEPSRLGPSARRGVQRLLAHGTVAIAGELASRPALDAVRGVGLVFAARPQQLPGPVSLSPRPLVLLPPLVVGGPARFAVFDVPSREELVRLGAGTCVATVIGGRLVYRAH